jgi:benzoyl-CoA reductase subunit A|tara:strand:- start:2 stop:1390 length:1389 start_codon:yes stop_codon:yes gene_type:complete
VKRFYLGVDLGSTTSKAIIINEKDEIIGRGITNTRANYRVAVEIAKLEAIFNARFHLLKKQLEGEINQNPKFKKYVDEIEAAFQYLQFKKRSDIFYSALLETAKQSFSDEVKDKIIKHIDNIFNEISPKLKSEFIDGDLATSNQFFRDIMSEKYNEEIEKIEKELFEPMMLTYDKSITPVENEMVEYDFKDLIYSAMDLLKEIHKGRSEKSPKKVSGHFDAEFNILTGNYKKGSYSLKKHIDYISDFEFNIANMVGTGYGRALLPFPEDSIKSEILCHAFGAHAIFPYTRTVLDIGGQDTKAIQVDKYGLVTSFNMNDRCAAGCGRYLGYIADEFSISLNELGPEALEAEKEVTICSTCTVFAGAEVRELLNVGEKRSNILAGLHKSIVMRAMSLIARSGGVKNEFTFTGGVARNQAVLKYVGQMVHDSYGKDIKINIGSDSIFMGALGGAMFARRASLKKN